MRPQSLLNAFQDTSVGSAIRYSIIISILFNNHQHIILLVLKQKLKTTYRGLIEILKVAEALSLAIGLKRIPHHTTLVKFARKISKSILNLLFPAKNASKVAVDYSGFELEAKSYYYRKKFFMFSKKRNFMRTCLLVDTDKQMILGNVINRRQGNDNTEFVKLLKNANVDYVTADKGYSSKKNRKLVLYKLCAMPLIPYKRTEGVYRINNGRKKLEFDKEIYHQRSKIETVFGVLKRKYSSTLKGRTYLSQQKELIIRLITYNVDRLTTLYKLLILGFQQSCEV